MTLEIPLQPSDIPLREPRNGRLTVVGSVSHQIPGRQPTHTPLRYCSALTTAEQPFIRQGIASKEWRKIETGWIKGAASLLLLSNDEGIFSQKVPTEEERERVNKLTIELGILPLGMLSLHDITSIATVKVKRHLELEPTYLDRLYIGAFYGDTRYTLTLIS